MNIIEQRATFGLAALYALRMLGFFLILPVFSATAAQMPGGERPALVGLALGAFGLTQALFQLPMGMYSDQVGRKRVIYFGLGVFFLGSVLCATASHMIWLIVGRAVQGAGAISAALIALLADLTREEYRTRAMAMIGGSIAITFAISLVAAPLLLDWIGLSGIFLLTAGLSGLAVLIVRYYIPNPISSSFHSDAQTRRSRLPDVLKNPTLLKLNYGVFALHATQMAMFMVLPLALVQFGLAIHQHWKIYLPLVLLGFTLMVPIIIFGEKKHHLKDIFIFAILLMLLIQLGMAFYLPSLGATILWLSFYFIAFNILEAIQPSLISKFAPVYAKGTAMGVYNTCQSASLFVGGALGGYLLEWGGYQPIFILCSVLMLVWLWFAYFMETPQPVKTVMLHFNSQDSFSSTLVSDKSTIVSDKLRTFDGVVEAVVLVEERLILLKVLQTGWDETSVQQWIKEINKNGIAQ